jgi:hypothetical protein
MQRAAAVSVIALIVALVAPVSAQTPSVTTFLFSPEGDRVNIYEVGPEGVIAAQTDVDTTLDGEASPPGATGEDRNEQRDSNGQLCFFEGENGETLLVGGEDANQASRTPLLNALRLQGLEGEANGWGIYRVDGTRIGEFGLRQIGKMVPTYQPHFVSQFEHFGCGILSDGRIVTADIGDQYPGFPASGQLHVWFPPYDSFNVRSCKIDVGIPTAGGIHIDEEDRIHIGAQRDDVNLLTGMRAGIHRYTVDWERLTGPDPRGGCGRLDFDGKAQMIDADLVEVEHLIEQDLNLLTPSSVVPTPQGTLYVSSVFDGRINEYTTDGAFVRQILAPPMSETGQPPYSTGTPLGLAIGVDGTLYYADLGMVAGPPPGPARGEGSVRMIRFDEDGEPVLPPVVLDEGLAFPDGLGLLEVTGVDAAGQLRRVPHQAWQGSPGGSS